MKKSWSQPGRPAESALPDRPGPLAQLSETARSAICRRDWPAVAACARAILASDNDNAEGHFLAGMAAKAGRPREAAGWFQRALALDGERYDAAIELAHQYAGEHRHAEAAALVARYRASLAGSPVYLHRAGTVLASVGLSEAAFPLFGRAHALQPRVDLFQSSLATCSVFLGRFDEARAHYLALLERFPDHQRYHYQLSRLGRATDARHVDAMQQVLARTHLPPPDNVFLYYAIGKELEDLERWDEAFDWFRRAGDAVTAVADYDVVDDLSLIDSIVSTCDAGWLARGAARPAGGPTPVFVTGLPRSGTTLVERILASHSRVASLGELAYLPMAVRAASGIEDDRRRMTPAMIRAAATADAAGIAATYRGLLDFRLGAEDYFIDKLPFNVLYLGFIAKSLPDARLILLERHPLDACFAMYKQVFTGAYKFSYSLSDLARFYVGYRRLVAHWQALLGDRLAVVSYEALVAEPEAGIRRLLAATGLDFEEACLHFERNGGASATASAVQVREGMHSRSVGRWRRYAAALEPLRRDLAGAGIPLQ